MTIYDDDDWWWVHSFVPPFWEAAYIFSFIQLGLFLGMTGLAELDPQIRRLVFFWKLVSVVSMIFPKKNIHPQMDGLLPLEGMHFWMIIWIQIFVNFWHLMQQLLCSFLKRLWLMLVHFLAIGRGYLRYSQARSKSCGTLVHEGWKECLCWLTCVVFIANPKVCELSWGFEGVGKFRYMRL